MRQKDCKTRALLSFRMSFVVRTLPATNAILDQLYIPHGTEAYISSVSLSILHPISGICSINCRNWYIDYHQPQQRDHHVFKFIVLFVFSVPSLFWQCVIFYRVPLPHFFQPPKICSPLRNDSLIFNGRCIMVILVKPLPTLFLLNKALHVAFCSFWVVISSEKNSWFFLELFSNHQFFSKLITTRLSREFSHVVTANSLYLLCTQSVSLVVHYMIFIEKRSYPFMVHPLTASSQVVS